MVAVGFDGVGFGLPPGCEPVGVGFELVGVFAELLPLKPIHPNCAINGIDNKQSSAERRIQDPDIVPPWRVFLASCRMESADQ